MDFWNNNFKKANKKTYSIHLEQSLPAISLTMAKLISWKARCKICRVNKEPRLSIRKDIWILLSDSICQTQPNHIQIVRRQCCPATHSLGDSRAERKCPWSWIRSLLPTAVRDLNRGTGYNFVPKSLDAWFQRFNKTPQRSSRTTEKVNVKMRPNVTNPYLAVSIYSI